MDKNAIMAGIQHLYPDGADEHTSPSKPTPNSYAEFIEWWTGPEITEKKLQEAAVAELSTRQERHSRKTSLQQIRRDLFTEFQKLTLETREAFYLQKITITAAFEDGNTSVALLALDKITVLTDEEKKAKKKLLKIVEPLRDDSGKDKDKTEQINPIKK